MCISKQKSKPRSSHCIKLRRSASGRWRKIKKEEVTVDIIIDEHESKEKIQNDKNKADKHDQSLPKQSPSRQRGIENKQEMTNILFDQSASKEMEDDKIGDHHQCQWASRNKQETANIISADEIKSSQSDQSDDGKENKNDQSCHSLVLQHNICLHYHNRKHYTQRRQWALWRHRCHIAQVQSCQVHHSHEDEYIDCGSSSSSSDNHPQQRDHYTDSSDESQTQQQVQIQNYQQQYNHEDKYAENSTGSNENQAQQLKDTNYHTVNVQGYRQQDSQEDKIINGSNHHPRQKTKKKALTFKSPPSSYPQKDRQWDEMFQNLRCYRQAHGNCLVSQYDPENRTLGLWVTRQRYVNHVGMMREDRHKLLDAIDFVWRVNEPKERKPVKETPHASPPWYAGVYMTATEINDHKWNDMFERLCCYKKRHGDTLVSRSYPDDRSLAFWVSRQRYKQHLGLMRDDRVQHLESIGFTWHVVKPPKEKIVRPRNIIPNDEQRWEIMFDRLKSYKAEHGHCRVPYGYKEDTALGHWVRNQRATCKKKTLRFDRYERLESIGFTWSIFKTSYHNNENSCISPSNSYKCFKDSKNGASYNAFKQLRWNEKFDRLQEYKRQHGNCRVPYSYPADRQLGLWVQSQRMKNKANRLEPHRKQRLESIGFLWCANDDAKKWDNKFERLIRFKEKYGTCRVPTQYAEDRKLGEWVNTQRREYFNGRITDERIERLNSIGFIWCVKGKNKTTLERGVNSMENKLKCT